MEISEESHLKQTTICRACLSPENNLNQPFQPTQEYEKFLEMYKICTSVDLTEFPGLPPYICDPCILQTKQFNLFRDMCVKSHQTIQAVFKKSDEIVINENEEILVFHNLWGHGVKLEIEIQDTEGEMLDSTTLVKQDPGTFDDYKCFLCKETFREKSLLTGHINSQHKQASTSFVFACNRCDKPYKNVQNLEAHINIHLGLKPFKCGLCPKAFTTQAYLRIHLDAHNPRFLCCECGQSFSTKLLMNRHKVKHGGKRPFPCELCPSSFTISADLAIHMRTHNDERPYLCYTCGKAFRRGYHLKVHRRIHTGEKPYKCSYCEKRFTQTSDWRTHERLHTGIKPYHCDICNRRFNQSNGLNVHLQSHALEGNLFGCKSCRKAFAKKEGLYKHLLMCKKQE